MEGDSCPSSGKCVEMVDPLVTTFPTHFPASCYNDFLISFLVRQKKWKRKSFVTAGETWLVVCTIEHSDQPPPPPGLTIDHEKENDLASNRNFIDNELASHSSFSGPFFGLSIISFSFYLLIGNSGKRACASEN